MSGKDEIVFIDKTKKKDNMFCELCSFPLLTKSDFDSNKKYEVCNECFLTFAEARKNEWLAGWRPDKQKIKEYTLKRKSIIKNK